MERRLSGPQLFQTLVVSTTRPKSLRVWQRPHSFLWGTKASCMKPNGKTLKKLNRQIDLKTDSLLMMFTGASNAALTTSTTNSPEPFHSTCGDNRIIITTFLAGGMGPMR